MADRGTFTVGLTGGIASGKSAVSDRLAALGAGVIDADHVARELTGADGAAIPEIVTVFGSDVLAADGSLDRRRMREYVFRDAAARAKLEAILHPRVRTLLRERARKTDAPYSVVVVPLLVETGQYDWVDRVLVVDVPRELQHARLIARDAIDADLAHAMLDAQATREQRLASADDVIANAGTQEALDTAVRALHERYLALARER